MTFITIDGDDIGARLTTCYLANDVKSLTRTKSLVEQKTLYVAEVLRAEEFEVFFCAADGVAASSTLSNIDEAAIFEKITCGVGKDLTFSAGVGSTLSEAYIALLYAKSTGKNRLCRFDSMVPTCLE